MEWLLPVLQIIKTAQKRSKINVGAAALTYEEIGMNVDGMTLQVEGEDKVELQPTDKRAVLRLNCTMTDKISIIF